MLHLSRLCTHRGSNLICIVRKLAKRNTVMIIAVDRFKIDIPKKVCWAIKHIAASIVS